MRTDVPFFSSPLGPGANPEAETLDLAAQVAQMIAVADTLVQSRRYVDLQGLSQHVGLLCAKALDLPPARTGLLKLELDRIAAAIDGLHAKLRENAA